jgi:hypothetical protein
MRKNLSPFTSIAFAVGGVITIFLGHPTEGAIFVAAAGICAHISEAYRELVRNA